jgi:hypothetical protein
MFARNRGEFFNMNHPKGEQLMYTRRIFSTLIIIAAMAAMLTVEVRGQSNDASAKPQTTESATTTEPSILGTWNVTQTSAGGFQFQWHYTFMPGSTSDDGTLITSSSLDLVPNPVCVPEQGVWMKIGIRQYALTRATFCFDEPSGDPAGSAKWRTVITLGRQGNGFVGSEHLDAFDPQGHLVFSADDTLRATRMQVEMPPARNSSNNLSVTSTNGGWLKWR